jgi:hypothetical protein
LAILILQWTQLMLVCDPGNKLAAAHAVDVSMIFWWFLVESIQMVSETSGGLILAPGKHQISRPSTDSVDACL